MKKWRKIKCLAIDIDGVMTDGRIFKGPDSEWYRFFYIRDGLGLVNLKKAGFKVAVITSSDANDIRSRVKKLKIEHFYENVPDKALAFKDLLKATKLNANEVAYIGDDIIDLPVFELCGISIAPKDAHKKVLKKADWVTKNTGGHGAVREICDLLLEIKKP